jgi:hypothetical protein
MFSTWKGDVNVHMKCYIPVLQWICNILFQIVTSAPDWKSGWRMWRMVFSLKKKNAKHGPRYKREWCNNKVFHRNTDSITVFHRIWELITSWCEAAEKFVADVPKSTQAY